MTDSITNRAIWPSLNGDHRAARRTPAVGPAHGRVRSRIRLPSDALLPPLVDAAGRMWLLVRDRRAPVLTVLSPAGNRLMERRLDEEDSPERANEWPHMTLVGDGICLARKDRLELRGPDGNVRAAYPIKRRWLAALGLTPDGDLLVWHSLSLFASRLDRIDPEGSLRWSASPPKDMSACIMRAAIACDDAGTIYLQSQGRLGDGVSGDDIPTGGIAIYSPDGELLASPALDPRRRFSSFLFLAGQARSAIVGTNHQLEIDRSGRVLREQRASADDPDNVRFEAFDLGLSTRSLDPSLLLGFTGSTTHIYNPIVDACGQRFVSLWMGPNEKDAVASFDSGTRCAFQLSAQSLGGPPRGLAMGADHSLLVTVPGGLVIVE